MVLQSFIPCGLFSKTVRPNIMFFVLYQLFPHHCSVLHNQNQNNLSFLNINKSLEQTEKYTKGFEHYYYIYRFTGLINRCTFGLSNRLAGSSAPATDLDLNRFCLSPFREFVWNLSTQVNNILLAA